MRCICFLLAMTVLISCGPNAAEVALKRHQDSVLTIIRTDTLHRFDTIRSKGCTAIFTPVSKKEYDAVADKGYRMPFPPGNEDSVFRQHKDRVSKADSTITIRCKNGKAVLLNSCPNTEMNDPLYQFAGQLKRLPFYVFSVEHYEGGNYELVNFNSGIKANICSDPIVAPNESRLASFFVFGLGGFTDGFEVDKIHGDSLEQQLNLSFENWGPSRIKWADDNTLYMEQTTFSDTGKEIITYTKVNLLD